MIPVGWGAGKQYFFLAADEKRKLVCGQEVWRMYLNNIYLQPGMMFCQANLNASHCHFIF